MFKLAITEKSLLEILGCIEAISSKEFYQKALTAFLGTKGLSICFNNDLGMLQMEVKKISIQKSTLYKEFASKKGDEEQDIASQLNECMNLISNAQNASSSLTNLSHGLGGSYINLLEPRISSKEITSDILKRIIDSLFQSTCKTANDGATGKGA